MSNFLQVGDVIELTKGMKVNAPVESRFVYANRRESKEMTHTVVSIGQILDDTHGNTFDTKKFAGRYVVVHAKSEGGGGSMHDPYPDGWHIIARKLKRDGTYSEKGVTVEFYQSGCFTCEILPKNISLVAKMKRIETFEAV